MKQKTLFKLKNYSSEFGGSLLKKKRKSARPLHNRNPLKIVLKSDSNRSPRLTQHRSQIEAAFKDFAKKFNVKIYEKAICGDHIHLVGLFASRESYTGFIRALTGTLARKFKIKFKFRPWTRILAWGRALKIALTYTLQNHLEEIKAIPYQSRAKDRRRTRQLLTL